MRRCPGTAVLLTMLFSCLACASPRLAQCPSEGGRSWQELESEHFTLRTDLPSEEAESAIGYLEGTRAALLAAAWPTAGSREMERITIYIFQSREEFEALFSRRVGGLFSLEGDEPLFVLHGSPASWELGATDGSSSSSPALKHELTHYLSSYLLPRQPRWLSEGLAQLLETMRLSQESRTAVLGTPHLRAVSGMRSLLEGVVRGQVQDFSIRNVLSWEQPVDTYKRWELTNMYWGSWLLVHWLYSTRPEQLAQLLAGAGGEPEQALSKVLSELSSMDLDATLLEYLQQGTYEEFSIRVPLSPRGYTGRTLDDAEVHAFRARLALVAAGIVREGRQARLALASSEVNEALKLEPASLQALALKTEDMPSSVRLPMARTAVKAHPEEGRAWLLLAAALRESASPPAEQEEAYKKALALAPEDARAAQGLAWLYITQRRYKEALVLAQRAVDRAPWSARSLDTYAMAAAGLGRCLEAIQAERQAIAMLQEHPAPDLERLLRHRLAGFSPVSCSPKL